MVKTLNIQTQSPYSAVVKQILSAILNPMNHVGSNLSCYHMLSTHYVQENGAFRRVGGKYEKHDNTARQNSRIP